MKGELKYEIGKFAHRDPLFRMKPDSGSSNHRGNHKAGQPHIHFGQIPGIDASANDFSNNPVIGVTIIYNFFPFVG
jgi:hypothetical protein